MTPALNILVIEDSKDDFELLLRHLKKGKVDVAAIRVDDEKGIKHELKEGKFDAVISDNSLPMLNAMRALRLVRAVSQTIPFIIVSGTILPDTAVNAMYDGVNDFVLKDDLKKLVPILLREVKQSKSQLEKRTIEKKLQQTEASYEALAHSITDVFFAIDASYRITYWNKAAADEFNLNASEVIGELVYDIFPSLQNSTLDERFRAAMETKSAGSTTFKYLMGLHGHNATEIFDGSVYPYQSGASVILKKVTEKRKAEQKLLQANLELETLIYRLSHDIRGPMSSISGLINVGKLQFKDPEIEDLLDKQERSVFELNKIIKTLMDLAEIKKGTVKVEKVVLNQIADQVIRGMKFNPGYGDVQIIVDIDPGHVINSDANMISNILSKLVGNSLRYKTGNAATLYIESIRHDTGIYLSVEDNGIGIPQDHQDRVFDMFYRASEKSTGSGLGLFMVKNALEQINGTINLKSVQGKGTRFDMLLPDLPFTEEQNSVVV